MNETFRLQVFGKLSVIEVDWNRTTNLIKMSLSENRQATVSVDLFEPTLCMLLFIDRNWAKKPTRFTEIQYMVDILDNEPVDRLYKAGLTSLGVWAESYYTSIQEPEKLLFS